MVVSWRSGWRGSVNRTLQKVLDDGRGETETLPFNECAMVDEGEAETIPCDVCGMVGQAKDEKQLAMGLRCWTRGKQKQYRARDLWWGLEASEEVVIQGGVQRWWYVIFGCGNNELKMLKVLSKNWYTVGKNERKWHRKIEMKKLKKWKCKPRNSNCWQSRLEL